MYATAAKLREMHFYTRLNKEFRDQTCAGGTFSWKVGMVSACSSAQPFLPLQPMNSPFKRMHQVPGVVEPFLREDGYN